MLEREGNKAVLVTDLCFQLSPFLYLSFSRWHHNSHPSSLLIPNTIMILSHDRFLLRDILIQFLSLWSIILTQLTLFSLLLTVSPRYPLFFFPSLHITLFTSTPLTYINSQHIVIPALSVSLRWLKAPSIHPFIPAHVHLYHVNTASRNMLGSERHCMTRMTLDQQSILWHE